MFALVWTIDQMAQLSSALWKYFFSVFGNNTKYTLNNNFKLGKNNNNSSIRICNNMYSPQVRINLKFSAISVISLIELVGLQQKYKGLRLIRHTIEINSSSWPALFRGGCVFRAYIRDPALHAHTCTCRHGRRPGAEFGGTKHFFAALFQEKFTFSG